MRFDGALLTNKCVQIIYILYLFLIQFFFYLFIVAKI